MAKPLYCSYALDLIEWTWMWGNACITCWGPAHKWRVLECSVQINLSKVLNQQIKSNNTYWKKIVIWNNFSFRIVCVISLAYSFPWLMTPGVYKERINCICQNVTMEVCKFEMNPSSSMSVFITLLFVIMVVNICLTTGLYIPVLKKNYGFTSFQHQKVWS